MRSSVERETAPAASGGGVEGLVAADTAFGFDLYDQLRDGSEENVFFSPYSVVVALTMTHAGARGDTAEQMERVLRLPFDGAELHRARNDVDLALVRGDDAALELKVANALWGQGGYPFDPGFLDVLARWYGAGMHVSDFASAAEAARLSINEWVEEQTEGKIRELMPEGTVDGLTRLVLVNGVYFKARWAHQFDPESTDRQAFHRLDGAQSSVPMVHTTSFFEYAERDGYQAIRLPYRGGASMIVVAPERGRFDDIEARFSPELLAEAVDSLRTFQVTLTMPRFEFTTSLPLADVLEGMGMRQAFTPPTGSGGADFTGITANRELFIQTVMHKAFVAVDEEGTEAAAATGVGVGVTSAPVAPPATLTLDRPFLFAIEDAGTGELLFLGRLLDPALDGG